MLTLLPGKVEISVDVHNWGRERVNGEEGGGQIF